MALTTTAISACNASLWLADVNGVQRDISGSSNSISIELTHTIGAVNAFQNEWPARQECGKDASIDLEVIYTETANEGWDVLKDWFFAAHPGRRRMTIYLPDKNIGSDMFDVYVRLETLSWTVESGNADPVMVSAHLLPDGALEHSDVAT